MDKKIIFLELPVDMINRIDQQNTVGTRSTFVSELIEKQFESQISQMDVSTEIPTTMQAGELAEATGEINLIDSRGISLGKFDVNTVEGFDEFTEKICQVSDDPIVRMKARRMR